LTLMVSVADPSQISSASPAPNRDLPSFPTRRSSDLIGQIVESDRHAALRGGRSGLLLGLGGGCRRKRQHRRQHAASPALRMGSRSEEHTSELQSRRDLVCRLLLEKKKPNTGATASRS